MAKNPFRLPVILFLLWPSIGWGMEASLTQNQIDEAIAKGKFFAELWRRDSAGYEDSVEKFFKQYEFGDPSTCNNGDVFTKIRDVIGTSMEAAKKIYGGRLGFVEGYCKREVFRYKYTNLPPSFKKCS